MRSIFITGTAGAGKSLLASKISEHYTSNGAFAAVLNLDPGADSLPYACEVDVRDHVDIAEVMGRYGLGPNGALVMAADMAAAKVGQIREQVDRSNPDYLIVDTPGQVELFAHRSSGPYIVESLAGEDRAGVFLFDGALASSAVNFVSVALLAASIRLRLGLPSVDALTKTDVIGSEGVSRILGWSASEAALEAAIAAEADGETYTLATGMLRGLDLGGFSHGLVPVSNVTGEGMDGLRGALSRMLDRGEEVEDYG